MKTIDLTCELNILPINDFKEKLAPEYIYLPINDNSTLYISIPSKVLKDDLIVKTDNVNYFASVSGEAITYTTINEKKYAPY